MSLWTFVVKKELRRIGVCGFLDHVLQMLPLPPVSTDRTLFYVDPNDLQHERQR